MLKPGPDHPITITRNENHLTISALEHQIAETTRALTLQEADYPAVQYIPRSDANMALLERTDHKTHCPYKGDCSYYSIVVNGERLENAVWTYENPYPDVAEIKDHLAFYSNKVQGL